MSPSELKDGTGTGPVRAFIRKAAAAFATREWRVSNGGLVYHATDGHWGRIDIDVGTSGGQGDLDGLLASESAKPLGSVITAQTPIDLTAGAISPYLLRVVNRLDPAKPPSVHYLHGSLLWQVGIAYQRLAAGEAQRLSIPQPNWASTGIILGPDTALSWFNDLFRVLVPAVSRLCSDRAIRDHLVEKAGETDFLSLRYAALLTRHMGLASELPGIVQRAAIASAAFDSMQVPPGAEVERNDGDPNMIMWTHDKFLRFLSSAPK